MNLSLKKLFTRKNVIILAVLFLFFLVAGIYQVHMLRVAHSSFENYYKFRGCVALVEKTETYGTCRLQSGQVIKLVQVAGRWFLDGDLGW